MKSDNNSPSIRFAGFADPWERRKLGELTEFDKGAGYSKSDIQSEGTPLILYGRLYTKYQTVINEIDTFTKPKTGSVFSKGGEVVIPASGETAEDISIASVIDKSGVIIGGDLNIILPCRELNPAFLAYSITFAEPHFKISQYAQGKSVVHIHNSDIKSVDVPYPHIPEQESICKLFGSFDRIITLHQRKYEKLVNLKKAMLDKMFPKNGELVPEVRFAGFSGNWERRKLGELVEFKRGLTYAPSDVVTYGIRVLRSSNIDGDTFVLSDADVFVRPSAVNIPFVKKGDILITAANGSSNLVGKHAVIDYTTGEMVHGGFMILAHPHKHSSYVNALISTPWYAEFIQTYIAGGNGAIGNLKMSDLSVQTVCVCSDKEQEKIGEYFANLNGYITLQHQKLEWLQKLKSAFLEKMFV